jgi:hypothetical protein
MSQYPNQPQQPAPGPYPPYQHPQQPGFPPPAWQQPMHQQYPPHYPPPPQPPQRKKNWIRRHPLWSALIALILVSCIYGAINDATTGGKTAATSNAGAASSTASQNSASSAPTDQPTATAATSAPAAPSVHYPPTTGDDLHGLAARGNASAIHEFHSESVGLTGACPQPKREVTVDPGVTGQHLAEDLLAYFYGQQLDSPCGSLVLAYLKQSDVNDTYTAGRINFDAMDSGGSPNVDPNATGLTYRLTLDVGGLESEKEYVVTY